MSNPIPKSGFFATLNGEEVENIIKLIPKQHHLAIYSIYYGTLNMCHEAVNDAFPMIKGVTPTEAEVGIKDIGRPVVTNRRPDW